VRRDLILERRDVFSSGVSWGAVIAGAFVMAALSLILLALGAGFGLAVISPWSNSGAAAGAFGAAAIIWLIIIEAVSAAIGGYLAGRLRVRWRSIHTHEVHFRDTANGFLAWAVALVASVSLMGAAGAYMAGNTPAMSPAAAAADTPYHIDRLFRSDPLRVDPGDAVFKAEAARVFDSAVGQTPSPPADVAYLSHLVAARTGMSQADAEQRVSATITEARQEEDAARRDAARVLLWSFVALLVGAFCASYAATIGGRQRDRVAVVEA